MTGTDPTSEASPGLRWLALPHCLRGLYRRMLRDRRVVRLLPTIRLHDSPGEPTRRFEISTSSSGAEALVRGNDIFCCGRSWYIYPRSWRRSSCRLCIWVCPQQPRQGASERAPAGASAWLGNRDSFCSPRLSKNLAPVIAFDRPRFSPTKIISDMRMRQTNMLMLACWSVRIVSDRQPSAQGGLGLSLRQTSSTSRQSRCLLPGSGADGKTPRFYRRISVLGRAPRRFSSAGIEPVHLAGCRGRTRQFVSCPGRRLPARPA